MKIVVNDTTSKLLGRRFAGKIRFPFVGFLGLSALASSALGGSAAANHTSMKRAPSPLAFASTVKRSFGLPSGSTKKMSAASASDGGEKSRPPLHNFRDSFSHSWIDRLSPEDPENLERSLRASGRAGHPGRPVFNGHYVRVRPTPLNNPRLVIHSPQLARELGFRVDEARGEPFAKYFGGDVDGAFENIVDESGAERKEIETWATPYALSIMGRRYTNNCPYGTGDGYGDGRAISVGEVLVANSNADAGEEGDYPHAANRYELQLKGAGQTPFCRGADGRAVLRSSIREFLASEAMHNLGVSTTRALSLVVSESTTKGKGSTSTRPWYSDNSKAQKLPEMDDPRLARYDVKQRREIVAQLAAQAKSDPDMMVEEKCAITTRVATSFVRIGHLDLFARRVDALQGKKGGRKGGEKSAEYEQRYQELEDMMWHACYREYHEEAYEPHWEKKDAAGAAMALMEGAMGSISAMVAGWVRVGFVQGNFNADNCLVGGRTMDYGPFGFLDVYHPLSAKWTGSGEHFGFMNQPDAGLANFGVLVESLLPVVGAAGADVDAVREEVMERARSVFSDALQQAIRSKMGLEGEGAEGEAEELWGEIEPLLRTGRGDWTLFWRQLTYVATEHSPAKGAGGDAPDYDAMTTMLLGEEEERTYPFYDALTEENRAVLRAWIERWHGALTRCHADAARRSEGEPTPPEETMRLANPKYTLREWMLVEAYSKADTGKSPGNPFAVKAKADYSGVHDLFALIEDPYAEGSEEHHERYYRRAPDESLRAGGCAFMS